jgi:hypothetical protein
MCTTTILGFRAFRAFFWFPVFGQFKNFLPQSLGRVWTLESGPNISRLRGHPEGPEMLSLGATGSQVRDGRGGGHRRSFPSLLRAYNAGSAGLVDGTGYPTRSWGVGFCGSVW